MKLTERTHQTTVTWLLLLNAGHDTQKEYLNTSRLIQPVFEYRDGLARYFSLIVQAVENCLRFLKEVYEISPKVVPQYVGDAILLPVGSPHEVNVTSCREHTGKLHDYR